MSNKHGRLSAPKKLAKVLAEFKSPGTVERIGRIFVHDALITGYEERPEPVCLAEEVRTELDRLTDENAELKADREAGVCGALNEVGGEYSQSSISLWLNGWRVPSGDARTHIRMAYGVPEALWMQDGDAA